MRFPQLPRLPENERLHKEKPKQLIVDDAGSILVSMKWAFAQDCSIFLAGNRQEALEIFKRKSPPLVTLELGRPPHARGREEGSSRSPAPCEDP